MEVSTFLHLFSAGIMRMLLRSLHGIQEISLFVPREDDKVILLTWRWWCRSGMSHFNWGCCWVSSAGRLKVKTMSLYVVSGHKGASGLQSPSG